MYWNNSRGQRQNIILSLTTEGSRPAELEVEKVVETVRIYWNNPRGQRQYITENGSTTTRLIWWELHQPRVGTGCLFSCGSEVPGRFIGALRETGCLVVAGYRDMYDEHNFCFASCASGGPCIGRTANCARLLHDCQYFGTSNRSYRSYRSYRSHISYFKNEKIPHII